MEMTKEIMYDQFKTLKSNNEKVKYLVDLKNFNNLIREYSSVKPFSAMHREIAEREELESKKEAEKRKQ